MKSFDDFILNAEEPNKGCFLAIRDLVLAMDENISTTIKYGMPCFCYRKKAFAYLWSDKKSSEPYILMVEGKLLKHPKLEQGSRARMKIYRLDPNGDLPVKEIKMVLGEALDLYYNGIVRA